MTAIKLSQFNGEIPRIKNAAALPPFNAQTAKDCNLLHGDLRPLSAPILAFTPTKAGTIQTIYLFNGTTWFHWTELVDVVKSAIAGDTTERTYFTGATGKPPQMTNNTLATSGGTLYPMNSYDLGIPAPAAAPTVSATANSDDSLNDSRAYVYTYVSAYGDEGPPSNASSVVNVDVDVFGKAAWAAATAYSVGDRVAPSTANDFVYECTVAGTSGSTEPTWPTTIGGTVTDNGITWKAIPQYAALSGMSGAPSGNYNISTIRIYRTATSNNTTEYEFVVELPVADTTYNDLIETSALGEVLPSTYWVAPPSDMVGIIMLPNGMMAGFSGNQVCLCEPYQYHAWPISYRQAVPANIIGLIGFGASIAVLTDNAPWIMTGVYPSSMTMDRSEVTYACISKRSIVDMGYYGIYAAPEGLIQVGSNGFSIATEQLFTPDQWAAYNPSSIIGFFWQGRYVGFYDATSIGGSKGGFILDPQNPAAGWTELSLYATGGYYDKATGTLYIIESVSNTVMEFNADTADTYTWKSKIFRFIDPKNFAVCKISSGLSSWVSGDTYAVNDLVSLAAHGNGLKYSEQADNGIWAAQGGLNETAQLLLAGDTTLSPGTGPVSFSRADATTCATQIDPTTGLVTLVAANVLRYQKDSSGAVQALIEQSSTNLWKYSEQFDNGAWMWNGGWDTSLVPNSETAPDGNLTADVIGQSSATGLSRWVSNTTCGVLAIGNTYTMSVWIKGLPGVDAAPGVSLWAYNNGGSSPALGVTTQWQRFSFTFTVTQTTLQYFGLRFGWDENGAANDYRYALWGAQIEQLSMPTSYIPTTSAAVTRAADSLSIPNANIPTLANGATLICQASLPHDGQDHYIFWTSGGGGATGVYRDGASGYVVAYIGYQAIATTTTPDENSHVYALRANSTLLELLMDGIVIGSTTGIPGQPTNPLYLGSSQATTGFINSTVGNLLNYPRALSNSELASIQATVTANAATAPDGNVTADKLIGSADAVFYCIAQAYDFTAADHTVIVRAKADGYGFLVLQEESSGVARTSWFDLTNGVAGTVDPAHTMYSESLGGGWYKVAITFAANAGVAGVEYGVSNADAVSVFTGDGASGIDLWGMEIVPSADVPSIYSKTTSAVVPYRSVTELYKCATANSDVDWDESHWTIQDPFTAKIYADGVLKHTQYIADSNEFPLPDGFLGNDWEVELSGIVPVNYLAMAESVEELAME